MQQSLTVGFLLCMLGAMFSHLLKAKVNDYGGITVLTLAHGLVAGFISFMIGIMAMIGFRWPLPDDLLAFLVLGVVGGVLMRLDALENMWNR